MLDRYTQDPTEEFTPEQFNRARQAYINRKKASTSTASTSQEAGRGRRDPSIDLGTGSRRPPLPACTSEETDRASQSLRRHDDGDCAAATVVMDEEADKLAYDAHLTAYFQTFQPVSQPEYDAVRRAADAQWRYDRLISIETGLLDPARLESPTTTATATQDSSTRRGDHHRLAVAFREAHIDSDTNALELCHHYLGTAEHDIERFIRKFYSLRRKKVDGTNPA